MTAIKLTPPFITGLSWQRVSHIIQMTTEKSEGREFDPHPGQLVLRDLLWKWLPNITARYINGCGDDRGPFIQRILRKDMLQARLELATYASSLR